MRIVDVDLNSNVVCPFPASPVDVEGYIIRDTVRSCRTEGDERRHAEPFARHGPTTLPTFRGEALGPKSRAQSIRVTEKVRCKYATTQHRQHKK